MPNIQPHVQLSHQQDPLHALPDHPMSFGIDSLFDPATLFIRRATDPNASTQQATPLPAPAAPTIATADIPATSHGAQGNFRSLEEKPKQVDISDIAQRFQQDAWMYTKPRHTMPKPNRGGRATVPEVSTNIGAELALWLDNNPDTRADLLQIQDEVDQDMDTAAVPRTKTK
ncbi:hypothetical protein HDU89_006422 [Geranomyces variabilis]|nr:hypothetical protein HDU89_006422 [Geranomyces variabilis]